MKLSNNLYNVLKWLALVALDALGLLYYTLSSVWGLPFGDEVQKTCAALSVCIGTLIGVAGATYNKKLGE